VLRVVGIELAREGLVLLSAIKARDEALPDILVLGKLLVQRAEELT
jgi:hypothetical protein